MWHIGKYAIAFISIHAPARGATQECVEIIEKIKISIHAPARGATSTVNSNSTAFSNFNPRSREGSDDYDTVNFWQARDFNPRSREGSDAYELSQPTGYNISIHAPARGATLIGVRRANDKRISIHAPARGAT